MTFLKFWWFCFVSFLVRVTYDFDPIAYRVQHRELVAARVEKDKLRVALVRALDLVKLLKQEAITWPNVRAAEPVTKRSMRAAEPFTEYLNITPAGDGAEIPR